MLVTGKQEKQILAQVPAMIQIWDYHDPAAPRLEEVEQFLEERKEV